jgi:hypothetical protein
VKPLGLELLNGNVVEKALLERKLGPPQPTEDYPASGQPYEAKMAALAANTNSGTMSHEQLICCINNICVVSLNSDQHRAKASLKPKAANSLPMHGKSHELGAGLVNKIKKQLGLK